MFDREMINENKEAFFLYVNGRGELSAQCVIKVAEKGDYLQGYSLTRRAFRTFLKDRVIQMFSSDQELNKVASETDFISILPPPENLHPKRIQFQFVLPDLTSLINLA
ncbi:hypothetical protein [Escherichia coli]|uniref:hypothetical protein n=1 Tax=Escherichia coli TaxID=562 RepID=UPI0022470CD9|nr:hypothetical protein [Escherichia coli]MCX0047510.1 hypothetical protein [Escherichia coli]